MDYMLNIGGECVLIEGWPKDEWESENYAQRRKLFEECEKFIIGSSEEEIAKRKEALKRLLCTLSESGAKQKNQNLVAGRLKKMLKFASYLEECTRENCDTKELEEKYPGENEEFELFVDAIAEVVDAVAEEDFENQRTVEINGNKFVYNAQKLRIEEHLQKLKEIGEKRKGETWAVFLDEDGELVVY